MAVSAQSLEGALARLVGAERLGAAPAAREAHAIDGCVPRWVVAPATETQVAGVVALAHEEGLAVVPRGSGQAQALGARPARLDIVLRLDGLDTIVAYSPDDLTATVQAGVPLGTLNGVLAAHGQQLTVDPPAGAGRTVGGIAATNAWGPLRARYGTMRDLLLGVRFVQADGVLTWGGARVVKSVTGYDVPKLMVGALGTLGVLTELTLRLHPRPEMERTWLARLPSVRALQGCLDAVIDSSLQPSRVEVFDSTALALIDRGPAGGAVVPPPGPALAVSIGSVATAVDEQGARLAELVRAASGLIEEHGPSFWTEADALERGEDVTVLEVAALPASVGSVLEAIAAHAAALGPGARAGTTGAALLGLLRVTVRGAGPEAVARLVASLRGVVADGGGSVVIERAPLAVRMSIDPWGSIEPGALALMRALKDEFDPRRVLNPGRYAGGL